MKPSTEEDRLILMAYAALLFWVDKKKLDSSWTFAAIKKYLTDKDLI